MSREHLDRWPTLPVAQRPPWPDEKLVAAASATLSGLPALVHPYQVDALRSEFAQVSDGRAFVLQAGDCAETFETTTHRHLSALVHTLREMSTTLTTETGLSVVTVGRVAGQYAKPRTSDFDEDGLPVYRGDMVNDRMATPRSRVPDPNRMLLAYDNSAKALGLLRSVDNNEPHLYSSHEALILEYERALTRRSVTRNEWYDLSAHLVWVGDRTRRLDGAHIDFVSRIANPIGVKLGPSATPREVAELVKRVDPHNIPGRLVLITRLGASNIYQKLPSLIASVQEAGDDVVWVCDPMHGNTVKVPGGRKTRYFDDVVAETFAFFDIHRQLGTRAGGVHLELTGADVSECVGGASRTTELDTKAGYESACDPRFNRNQSLEFAALIAQELKKHRTPTPQTVEVKSTVDPGW